jgi:phage shock protein C
MKRGRIFRTDKANGKLFGVCAGIANYTGWDVTLVRVGAVLVTLLGAFPWTVIAYAAAAFIAKPRGHEAFGPPAVATGRVSTYELRHSMRDIDRRMAEVETYVTSANSGLAREIDSLR